MTKIRSVRTKLVKLNWSYRVGPLFARKQSKTFEEATDEAIDALKEADYQAQTEEERYLINSFTKIYRFILINKI